MPSESVEVGQAFSLGMTADDVLVALARAAKNKRDDVDVSVCHSAVELLKDMEVGCNLHQQGGFSAAPESVRRAKLYNYAVRALQRAHFQVGGPPMEALRQIRDPLERIANREPPGDDAGAAYDFFTALAFISTEEINGVLDRDPWRSEGGGGRSSWLGWGFSGQCPCVT